MPYVDIHTHHQVISDNIIQIVNSKYNEDMDIVGDNSSIGIHPWEIGKIDLDQAFRQMNERLKDPRIVALGEIGLDRTIETSLEWQMEVFVKQLHLAKALSLPVIIHTVKTISETIKLKKEEDTGTPWIIHGFSGNEKEVEQLISKGFYISFGTRILQTGPQGLPVVPIDRIFFETDDQVKVDIIEIYSEASRILQLDFELLKERIFTNFKGVFPKCMVGKSEQN